MPLMQPLGYGSWSYHGYMGYEQREMLFFR
jgi:hypothetical protein